MFFQILHFVLFAFYFIVSTSILPRAFPFVNTFSPLSRISLFKFFLQNNKLYQYVFLSPYDKIEIICKKFTFISTTPESSIINSKEQFFIYAGYVFLSHSEKDHALAAYRKAAKNVNPHPEQELKAHGAKGKTKRYLNSVLRESESLACIVDTHRVYPTILNNKKSIHRYKDYCLKRIAKAKLNDLIAQKKIDPTAPTTLRFFIDNQPTSTDGVYNLKESIREELSCGISNFDYGVFHAPIFSDELIVTTSFCDSRKQPLIQAADILANCLFIQRNYNPKVKHKHSQHIEILLP